jgi:hypothetical protein
MKPRLKPWPLAITACHFVLLSILFPVSSPLSLQRPCWHASSAQLQTDSWHVPSGKRYHKDSERKLSLEFSALAWQTCTFRGSQTPSAFLRKCRRPALPSFAFRRVTHKNSHAPFGKGASEEDNSKDWIHEGDIVIIGGQRFQRKNGRFSNLDVSSQEIEYNVQIELASIREGVASPEEDERFEDDDFEKDPTESLDETSMSQGSTETQKDKSNHDLATFPSYAGKEPTLDEQGE